MSITNAILMNAGADETGGATVAARTITLRKVGKMVERSPRGE